ncbi:MAG: nickel pincer cofactor biosynthesis protein LarB [Burkholderiales bacterium]|nr:nickel pincer cofactor biosynthesis protein LarB [Burkholderiales bacterium]OUT78068.1 MAG: circadian phase modifier CpmA [Betaproteobacteria bacterium TMED22]|tara:strand:+ start:13333 stop:13998 length:666 start_codon:yes stop_codon:yes gene_type:complete
MSFAEDIKLDFNREDRIGLDEAIFCEGKTSEQIAEILRQAQSNQRRFLLTRLSSDKQQDVLSLGEFDMDYDPISRTAYFPDSNELISENQVSVICAGTSDVPVAKEVVRTLRYYGHLAVEISDVGVAGLWRLLDRLDDIKVAKVVVVIAGMDAALPTVLGGLVAQPLIGVPTSVGYGVAQGGTAALQAMLASCSPGITVTNIDNGYGGACAALRILRTALT